MNDQVPDRISPPLCRLDDLKHGTSMGVTLKGPGQEILVVRHAGRVFAYENRCPHTGVTLDWVPHRFLNETGDHIQCSTHGARFRIEDGFCVHGPCTGAYLTSLPVAIIDGMVRVHTGARPACGKRWPLS